MFLDLSCIVSSSSVSPPLGGWSRVPRALSSSLQVPEAPQWSVAERGPRPSLHTAPRLPGGPAAELTGHGDASGWQSSAFSLTGTQGFSSLSLLSPESRLTAPQPLRVCIPRGHLQPVRYSRPRPDTHTPSAHRSHSGNWISPPLFSSPFPVLAVETEACQQGW